MKDEVDEVVAAWQRERPDVDLAPLEVLSRVSRLAKRVDRARATAFRRAGVEAWEFDVLAALRRAGRPYQLTPGRLTDLTLVTSGTMTNRIDRLEQRRLVRRLRDPSDRRSVHVQLTALGRTKVDSALDALLTQERDMLAGLSPRQRAILAGLLRRLVASYAERQT